ncbi:YqeG family HAD IIIA-type phosphatase [Dendrosporobacter sp. 1207_IL3150]|uniref:YqeG family HAD IIIA-type phosphatase n=1 Tax=Dendrosporobacter sp. 1207_IL3150 TaxID=3084054 RepID=UPI002FDA3D56
MKQYNYVVIIAIYTNGGGFLYHLLKPNCIAKSLHDIELELLKKKGIKGVIFDLDNTIIAWDSPSMQPEIISWIGSLLEQDYRICLLSNNMTHRVKNIAELLGVPYVPKAYKPAKTGFRRAIAQLKLKPSEIAVIGDQLFTDVLGGNRLGLFTIWVAPLSTNEFIGTKITRKLEKLTVRLLKFKGIIK